MSTNIHEFQPGEVVDYRQVNDNFSNLNNNMLHYKTATVTAYNSSTYETTVRFEDNTTATLINRTANILSINDSVYVYYWNSVETDGYVGVKLGTPTIQGGGSVPIGRYLNSNSNSILINDLSTNTKVNIPNTNSENNMMLSTSNVVYDSTYSTPMSDNNIIGNNINLYNVCATSTNIIGNSSTVNSYASYDSTEQTYTYKSLYLCSNTNIIGTANFFYDNRTTYGDTTNAISYSNVLGYNNTFNMYDDAIIGINDQKYTDATFIGNRNSVNKSSLYSNVSVFGNDNTFSDAYVQFCTINGHLNEVGRIKSGNSTTASFMQFTSLLGYNNKFKLTSECNGSYGMYMIGGENEAYGMNHIQFQNNYLFGYKNKISDVNKYLTAQFLYAYGANNSFIGLDSNNNYTAYTNFMIGASNTFKPIESNSNMLIGIGNKVNVDSTNNVKLSNSTILGVNNTLRQSTSTYSSSNVWEHSTVIGDSNEIGSNTLDANISFHYSNVIGVKNKYGANNATSYKECNYLNVLGSSNNVNNTLITGTVIGNNNVLNNSMGCYIVGDSNQINYANSNINTYDIHNVYMLGKNNKAIPCTYNIYDTATGTKYSTFVGFNNTLDTDTYLPMIMDNVDFGSHTIIGNYGSIKYSSNQDAYKIKMVLAVESLYDSSIPGSTGNAVTIDGYGNMNVVGTISSGGSDFAEYWEWQDGNTTREDRRGLFVTLTDDGYIKKASSDDKILGIVSTQPTITGGGDFWEWQGKYLKDVFGDYIYENVEEPVYTEVQELVKDAYTDDNNVFHEAEYKTVQVQSGTKALCRKKLNPNYDPTRTYVNRSERPEYAPIAHIGKVVMVDDGKAKTGDYLTSNDKGIATISETFTKFVCIKRLDNNHIYVLIDTYK